MKYLLEEFAEWLYNLRISIRRKKFDENKVSHQSQADSLVFVSDYSGARSFYGACFYPCARG
jgi:hypothetical protein